MSIENKELKNKELDDSRKPAYELPVIVTYTKEDILAAAGPAQAYGCASSPVAIM